MVIMSSKYVMWRLVPKNSSGNRAESANWFWHDLSHDIKPAIREGKFGVDLNKAIFMHDGCPCWQSNKVQNYLKNWFPIRAMLKNEYVS